MSETTSESGQAHLADEPSMEDILDSIRKIIADDDQTMDIAPPQALDVENPKDEVSGIEPELSPSSLVSETALGPSAEYDENSVFHSQRSRPQRGEGSPKTIDDLEDTVDLDIEALLSEAETPPESHENLSLQGFSVEDDLMDSLDIQIPEQEEESLSVGTDAQNLGEVQNFNIEQDLDEILDLSEPVEPAAASHSPVAEISDNQLASSNDEDESLFDDLEGLLADVPQDDADHAAKDADNAAKHTGTDTTLETDDMSDLDDIGDLLHEDAIIPQTNEAENSDKTAFHSDEADMDMVKSLMADLTEPEAEASPESAHSTDDMSPDKDDDIQDIADMLEMAFDGEGEAKPDTEAATQSDANEAENVDADLDDSDILDEIINMSLDDEMDGNEDLEIPEPDNKTEPETSHSQMQAEESYASEVSSEDTFSSLTDNSHSETARVNESEGQVTAQSLISSLMEIAGEAEHDAEAAEAKLSAVQASAAQSGQIADNTQNTAKDSPSAEAAETYPENVQTSADVVKISPETNQKETADMPKAAVNQDRILDEVSEEAASSAFASLNNMVEEKAIKAERGDRIGDLVMEALRPMLKEWLDEHLKDIVERAVTKEVQRISSGK